MSLANSSGNDADLPPLTETGWLRGTPEWDREHKVMVYGFRPGESWYVADVDAEIIARADSYLECLKLLAGERKRREIVFKTYLKAGIIRVLEQQIPVNVFRGDNHEE